MAVEGAKARLIVDDREATLHDLVISGDQESLLVATDLAIELNCGLPVFLFRFSRAYGDTYTGRRQNVDASSDYTDGSYPLSPYPFYSCAGYKTKNCAFAGYDMCSRSLKSND